MTLDKNLYLLYNIVLIGYILFGLADGYRKGFLRSLLDVAVNFAGIAAAYYASRFLYEKYPLYQAASSYKNLVNMLLWFLILQLTIRCIYSSIAAFIRGVEKVPGLSPVNRLGGLVLGAVLVWVSLYMVTIFLKLGVIENGADFVRHSILRGFDIDLKTLMRFLSERGLNL